MKIKPLIFNIYAFVFIAIAVSIPIQVMFLYGHGATDIGAIWSKMTVFNFMVMASCFLNAYFSFTAQDDIKWSFPLSIGFVCLNNSIVLVYGNDFEAASVILSTFAYILMTSYFILSHETNVINSPAAQWWKTAIRYQAPLPTKVSSTDIPINLGETFDISRTGAYISYNTPTQKDIFNCGDTFTFNIGTDLELKAKVVRKSNAVGRYPEGMGVQFVELGVAERLQLEKLLTSLRQSVDEENMDSDNDYEEYNNAA
ncbi:type IV pilus assembly protein PilZ [Bacteriovorax sp. BAL6_X]|uniref:PilZ domain-containing protein n=1 Tax=Bacteriovorax sp. BAL6_X TaxID=1201290 RepID=UPI0003864924|nr:PilZ domain-containing protein [Bacteriovorax sp. BAL6_X]EPZ51244.1 type IV pilus assembly protein PilZ [Bacteriovorax sp. BAL6_X]